MVLGCLPALAERVEVVKRISGCDYFIAEGRLGYDVLEWYGGHDPDVGDVLIGNFFDLLIGSNSRK
jgi:hypothetical protein